MKDLRDALASYEAETRPGPDARARVAARLAGPRAAIAPRTRWASAAALLLVGLAAGRWSAELAREPEVSAAAAGSAAGATPASATSPPAAGSAARATPASATSPSAAGSAARATPETPVATSPLAAASPTRATPASATSPSAAGSAAGATPETPVATSPLAAASATRSTPGAPAPLDLPLRNRGDVALTETVTLAWAGRGHATGTAAAPRLAWVQGALTVEVTPERGVDLRVATEEADVAVVGTGFRVLRDALGTHVSVSHGAVAVTCVAGERATLRVGEALTCRPVRGAPLLRRARALAPEAPEAALEAVDAALADPSRPPLLDDELAALRVALLSRLDRGAEALRAADAYLAAAGPRADEVARLALGHATGAARCRYLAALTTPTAAERTERTGCAEPSDPFRALPE